MMTIEIQQVTKLYQEVVAIRDAFLTVRENCLFGLIGPDGAGKTTLFRIITTLLLPDKGRVSVFGYDTIKDYRKIREFIGYMCGRFSLYPDLTVEENLSFYATIFGTSVRQNYNLIEPVYALLEPYRKRLAKNLSGGMKQKLALSCALIHNPKILLLDEPTTGVDAVSRKEFWDTLKMLQRSGMTILVSTPYMDEAAACDRVALIQEGIIMNEDEPGTILARYTLPLFQIITSDRFGLLNALRSTDKVKNVYLFGEFIHLSLESADYNLAWLKEKIRKLGFHDAEIKMIPADFEDCFIEAVEHTKGK
jgi:ABC-type multidrug transport system ATPase subunit